MNLSGSLGSWHAPTIFSTAEKSLCKKGELSFSQIKEYACMGSAVDKSNPARIIKYIKNVSIFFSKNSRRIALAGRLLGCPG